MDGEILPPKQHRIIEEAKFTYLPLGKALEKQIKTVEEQEKNKEKWLKIWENDQSRKDDFDIFDSDDENNVFKTEINI